MHEQTPSNISSQDEQLQRTVPGIPESGVAAWVLPEQTPQSNEQVKSPDMAVAESEPQTEVERVQAVAGGFTSAATRFLGEGVHDTTDASDSFSLTANNIASLSSRVESDSPVHGHISVVEADYLAAVEATTKALDVSANVTESQQTAVNGLIENKYGLHNSIDDLMYQREQAAEEATDPEQQSKLKTEAYELGEWLGMLESGEVEAKPSIAAYGSANDCLEAEMGRKNRFANNEPTSNPQERELADLRFKMGRETSADVYFAKYMPELVARAESEEQQVHSAEATEQATAQKEQDTANARSSVDEALGNNAGEAEPQTVGEKREAEMARVLNDPDSISYFITQGRSQHNSRMLTPMRERYAAEPTEANKKQLDVIEKDASQFTALREFMHTWQKTQENGETKNFAEYLQGLKDAEEAEITAATDAGNHRLASERVAYFDKLDAAYSMGMGSKAFSLFNMVKRHAQGVATGQLKVR
jgi:hypothetical protein